MTDRVRLWLRAKDAPRPPGADRRAGPRTVCTCSDRRSPPAITKPATGVRLGRTTCAERSRGSPADQRRVAAYPTRPAEYAAAASRKLNVV